MVCRALFSDIAIADDGLSAESLMTLSEGLGDLARSLVPLRCESAVGGWVGVIVFVYI